MASFKIASAVFVVAAGLVGGYFIVFDSTPLTPAENKAVIQPDDSQQATPLPLQWTDQATSSDNLSNNFALNNLTFNLTESAGKTLLEQISIGNSLNQNEADLPLGANKLSENALNDALVKGLSDLNLPITIDNSDLKISQDNSIEAKTTYLKAILGITRKNFSGFNKIYLEIMYENYGEGNPESAGRLAVIYKKMADDYLRLTVPSEWIDLHKDIIVYFKKAEKVYQAMADYPRDFIKGYLALELVDGLVNRAEQIQEVIGAKAIEVNLKL
jgi:hypothetical protein